MIQSVSIRQIHVIRVPFTAVLIMAWLLFAPSHALPCFAQEVQHRRRMTEPGTTSREAHVASAAEDRGDWVIAGYLGGAHTARSSLTISQPTLGNQVTFDAIRLDGESFDPPLYYGIRGGYFIRGISFLGVETEFIHLKVFADPQQRVRAAGLYHGAAINRELPLGQIVQRYSISHGVNLLLFNLAARYRVHPAADHPAGRVMFAGRFGVGPTIPHTESNIDGQPQQQYEVGRVGWQLAGGAEINLWRGLYALGEYKFTRTRQRGNIFGGEAESLLRSHHGVFGLSYHF
jgi:hypothetical protein